MDNSEKCELKNEQYFSYCLRIEGREELKFGITQNPLVRLTQLDRGNHPLKYYISHIKPFSDKAGAFEFEQATLLFFKDLVIKGEWLIANDLVERYIDCHFNLFDEAKLRSARGKKEVPSKVETLSRDELRFLKHLKDELAKRNVPEIPITKADFVNFANINAGRFHNTRKSLVNKGLISFKEEVLGRRRILYKIGE